MPQDTLSLTKKHFTFGKSRNLFHLHLTWKSYLFVLKITCVDFDFRQVESTLSGVASKANQPTISVHNNNITMHDEPSACEVFVVISHSVGVQIEGRAMIQKGSHGKTSQNYLNSLKWNKGKKDFFLLRCTRKVMFEI